MTQIAERTAREITNPATGDIVDRVVDTDLSEVSAAVERSVVAQRNWASVPRHERARILKAYAAQVRQTSGLAELLSREQGKPLQQAHDEIELHCRLFEGFANRVLTMEDTATFLDIQRGLERDFQVTRHEPVGVVAGIIPFNFPVELYAHKVAPALATRNSIVIKPSEETPLATTKLVDLLRDAGVPPDVVQIVYGGRDVGEALISHPAVAAVSFTGSTAAGISVATSSARTLKRVLLELGGNDAFIVLEDADLDVVTDQAVFGRTLSNGQCCCANKRLLIADAVYDEVVERLTDRFRQLRTGDPLEPGTDVGPLVKEAAARTVLDQIAQTVDAGASITTGGQRDGCFVTPTVLQGVRPDMDIARDMEVFGPVVALMRVRSDAEALTVANSTSYGLSGAVFTRDVTRAMSFAAQMQTGQVVINGTGLYRPDSMGFGGYKSSGNGREGLAVSLEEYCEVKTITFKGVMPAPTQI